MRIASLSSSPPSTTHTILITSIPNILYPLPSNMLLMHNLIPLHHNLLHRFHRPNVLLLALKHCPLVSLHSLTTLPLHIPLLQNTRDSNLQNANSSNVRFAVSGNKNHTNTTSYVNHATYTMSHLHVISSRPMGFTNVVKKPARRPKSWKTAIPRERSMYGHTSTMYAVGC